VLVLANLGGRDLEVALTDLALDGDVPAALRALGAGAGAASAVALEAPAGTLRLYVPVPE
jgi:hypothetical protein